MNAIVSGSLRAAVLVEGQALQWVDEQTERAVPCTPREVRRLTLGTSDTAYFQGVDESMIREILRRAAALFSALTRLSLALAKESPAEDKRRALRDLEELADDHGLKDDVLNVAFSVPPADLQTAREIARESQLSRSEALLDELASATEAIAQVRQAWDIVALDSEDASRIRSWAIRSGLFRTMVNAVKDREPVLTVDDLLESRGSAALRDVSVGHDLASDILGRWINELLKGMGATVGEWRRRAADRFHALSQTIGFDRGSIQILDGDERFLFVTHGFAESPKSRGLLRPPSHDALISRVLAGKRPLVIPDVKVDPDWTPTDETADIASWVGAPLLYQGRIVVGLITLDFCRSLQSSDAVAKGLQSFCREMAELLWIAGPLYRQRRLEHAMRTVTRTIGIISAKHKPQELLQAIVDEVAFSLKCSHCTIFLPEGRGPERELVARHTFGVSATRAAARFTLKQGLVGKVFDSGRTLVLPNAAEDSSFVPGRDAEALTRSMLLVPIKVADQNVGVICADQDEIGWFRKSDGRLLEMLSLHAGLAIQRASALDFLESIAQSMLSLPKVEAILRVVLQKAIDLVNATTGVIYLVDAKKTPIEITSSVPFDEFPHPEPRVDEDRGITNTVVQSGEVVAIPDIEKDDRVNRRLNRFRSLVAVPLKIGSEVIGVLFVDDEDRHVFSDVEQHLLLVLASQAAIAIQKADELRRNEELERQLVGLNQLVKIQSVQHVLDTVGNGICAIFGTKVSPTINLYNSTTQTFDRCCSYGPLAEHLRSAPRLDGFAAYVIREKAPLYLPDITVRPAGAPGIRREHRTLKVVSLAVVPLILHDKPLGVLFVNSQSPMAFTPEQRRKVELYATQAAVAISYARICEDILREEGGEPEIATVLEPS